MAVYIPDTIFRYSDPSGLKYSLKVLDDGSYKEMTFADKRRGKTHKTLEDWMKSIDSSLTIKNLTVERSVKIGNYYELDYARYGDGVFYNAIYATVSRLHPSLTSEFKFIKLLSGLLAMYKEHKAILFDSRYNSWQTNVLELFKKSTYALHQESDVINQNSVYRFIKKNKLTGLTEDEVTARYLAEFEDAKECFIPAANAFCDYVEPIMAPLITKENEMIIIQKNINLLRYNIDKIKRKNCENEYNVEQFEKKINMLRTYSKKINYAREQCKDQLEEIESDIKARNDVMYRSRNGDILEHLENKIEENEKHIIHNLKQIEENNEMIKTYKGIFDEEYAKGKILSGFDIYYSM